MDPDTRCGSAARGSRDACGLQQTLLGQAPLGFAGGGCLCQSRESKWTRERIQAEGTVAAHTEKCGRGRCARTMWLQEYFLGALRSRRQNRALLKVVLVLLGAAAVQGVGALRWKRFFARGKGARAACGRHAKLGSVAAKCSRHEGEPGHGKRGGSACVFYRANDRLHAIPAQRRKIWRGSWRRGKKCKGRNKRTTCLRNNPRN